MNINLDYDGISTKNIFRNDSILIDLIKSEILNNQNLNVKIDLNVNDITNINELNNLEAKYWFGARQYNSLKIKNYVEK